MLTGAELCSEFEALLRRWEQVAPRPAAPPDDPRLQLDRAVSPFEQIERAITRRVAAASGASAVPGARRRAGPHRGAQEAESAGPHSPSAGTLAIADRVPAYADLIRQRTDSGLQLLQRERKRKRETSSKPPQMSMPPPHVEAPACPEHSGALGETVFSVSIYHPVKVRSRAAGRPSWAQDKVEQQLLVLGSQPLSAIRDVIYCLKDKIAGDPSRLAACRRARAGRPSSSGYFFIENTFYNDERAEDRQLYSECITAWAAKHSWRIRKNEPAQELKEAKMETARLDQIGMMLGQPYLYCHQGNCEHLVVFNQIEAVHSCTDPAKFPLTVFERQKKLRECSICRIHIARSVRLLTGCQRVRRRVTYRDQLAPEEPCFFCELCYRQLHYSEDGYLLYDDFEQYEYLHE